MRVGRDASDGDGLWTEGVGDCFERAGAGFEAAFGHQRFVSLLAFGRGIDRAADATLASVIDSENGDDKVLDEDHRSNRCYSYDVANVLDFPTCSGAGENDIALFEIDEHILNALHAGQKTQIIGEHLGS